MLGKRKKALEPQQQSPDERLRELQKKYRVCDPSMTPDERLRELRAKYRQGMRSGISEAEVLELVHLEKELKS